MVTPPYDVYAEVLKKAESTGSEPLMKMIEGVCDLLQGGADWRFVARVMREEGIPFTLVDAIVMAAHGLLSRRKEQGDKAQVDQEGAG